MGRIRGTKGGFTLIEVLCALLIFSLSATVIYMIFTRNIKEQIETQNTLEALNFYKIDTFTIPADKEYYSYYKVNKIEGDKIIDLTEVQYQVIYKDQEVLLVNGIDYETGNGFE